MERGYSPGQGNTTPRSSVVRCDCPYLISPSGILKIVQALSSLIGFICAQQISAIGNCPGCLGWFNTATVTGLIFSLVLLFLYLFHIVQRLDSLPWLTVDLVVCLLWTIFNISIFWRNMAIEGKDFDSSAVFTAISVFSFISLVAYGCDGVLKVVRIIRRQPAQD